MINTRKKIKSLSHYQHSSLVLSETDKNRNHNLKCVMLVISLKSNTEINNKNIKVPKPNSSLVFEGGLRVETDQ